jgi:hypothetical protein
MLCYAYAMKPARCNADDDHLVVDVRLTPSLSSPSFPFACSPLPPFLFTQASSASLHNHLQQCLSQSTSRDATANPQGFKLFDVGINLHEIHSDKLASLMHTLSNEVSFSKCQAAADGRASTEDKGRVESVDVEGEVDWCIGAEVGESLVHYFADAVAGEMLVWM